MKDRDEIVTLSEVVAEERAEQAAEKRSMRRRAVERDEASESYERAYDDEVVLERKPKKKLKLNSLFGGDKALWIIIIALLIISMLLTLSATVYKPGGTPTSKLLNQLIFIVSGIIGLLIVHLIRYQIYGRIASLVFTLGLVLTTLALFIGPEGAGARRDLMVPGFDFSFQPFEILKIGLIMVMAKQLARRQRDIEDTPILPSFRWSEWKKDRPKQREIFRTETVPLLLPIFATCAVTFFAVGNSTTLIIAVTCFVMLYIGRVRIADLGKLAAMAAILAAILFATGLARVGTGKSRISTFNPEMMTKHTRVNSEGVEVYYSPGEAGQSVNAKMSIASGRFFGKGPGMSTHRSNLEEAEKDFAYAFIIEEYGAIGGLFVLLLFLWLFFRTIEIFKKCGTAFPSLLVLGLGLMITLQAMIHMLVSVALFPITGQQLPLISKGGTSLIFTLIALGMILGVSRQTANRTLDTTKDESLFEK